MLWFDKGNHEPIFYSLFLCFCEFVVARGEGLESEGREGKGKKIKARMEFFFLSFLFHFVSV